MRCLACGEAMEVQQIEPHEALFSCQYVTLRCTACGEIEKRALSRERVAAAEILERIRVAQPHSLPTPHDTIVQGDDLLQRTSLSTSVSHRSMAQRMRADLMNNPRTFIDAFVRNREQKD